jgi:glycine cleavage system H protein
LYTRTHEWVLVEDGTVTIGITQFAQEQLGDITYVELPEPGDVINTGEEMGTVESVKAASELYAPVTGEVIETNTELETAPELVNEAPYGEGWLIKVRPAEDIDPEELLSPAEYHELLDTQAH